MTPACQAALLFAAAALAAAPRAEACTPSTDPGACDDGTGRTACTQAPPGATGRFHLTVLGTGFAPIGACVYVSEPTVGYTGDVVMHKGSTGQASWNTFNASHRGNGLRVSNLVWDSAWEDSGLGTGQRSPKTAALRVKAALAWIHQNVHVVGAAAAFCGAGTSGGSGALLYSIMHHGAGELFDHVQLQAATPMGRIDVGCTPRQAPVPTDCPGVSLSPSYSERSASNFRKWTNVRSCLKANRTQTDMNGWREASVASAGARRAFDKTSISAFWCQTSPNETLPQGALVFGAANDQISFSTRAPAFQPDGTQRCAANAACRPYLDCATQCAGEAATMDPAAFNRMVADMKLNCRPRH